MAKNKMAPLRPSLREKKRYIVFEVISKDNLDISQHIAQLNKALLECLGTIGYAKAGIWFLPDKINANNGRGILRVSRKELDSVKCAFALIHKIEGKEVIIRTVGVSGILKKAQDKFMSPKQASGKNVQKD